VGGLPVMAHDQEEVAEMVSMAGALVINNGELGWHDSMLEAGRAANQHNVPIVLDPVGAGATKRRTDTAANLLQELSIQVVRGNVGEIGVLSGMGGEVKGVESVGAGEDPALIARHMARTFKTVAAITGKRDVISDGERTLGVDNGHSWLPTLTGTGCMATTVIAAFASVERDYLVAAAGALAVYGLAAELAAPQAQGPASFKVAFLDQLYNITPEQISEGVRIVEL
jgi:hydroxyethylthiazole kinase